MGNRRFEVDEEFIQELDLKVKIKSFSNYQNIKQDNIKDIIDDIKAELPQYIIGVLQNHNTQSAEITDMVDFVDIEFE